MASYQIGIDIVADNQATPEIQNAQDSLLGLEQSQSDFTNTSNQAADAATKQKSAFGELGGAVSNLLVAYAGMKGIQLVGEMIDQGNAVNAANQTFLNLTGGVDQARDALNAMRTATGGVVSDYDLMSGANRLLLMNLVQTGDEAARMTQIAVTLGRAMGHDAAESISDFAALLANQSIPRLDNFGISSDRVRQRLDELKASGMGAQEAFSMAVMEQGALALNRLGSATQAAITPIDQFKTAWGNFWDTFDSRVSQAVNGLIGLAQYATGTTQAQVDLASHALDNLAPIYQNMVNEMTSGANNDYILKFVQRGLELAATDPSITANAKEFGSKIYDSLLGEGVVAHADNFKNALTGIYADMPASDVFTLMATGITQVNAQIEYTEEASAKAKAAWSGLTDAMVAGNQAGTASINPFGRSNLGAGFVSNDAYDAALTSAIADRNARMQSDAYWDAYTQYWKDRQQQQNEEAQQAEQQAALDQWQAKYQAIQEAQTQLADFNTMGAGIGDYAFQEQADELKQKFEEIKALGDQGLISQDDVEKASQLADQAQKAADNMQNIKLPDVFGQTSGGLMGQISDDVIKQMQASGQFTPEQLKEYQQQLDLASGKETSASVAYQESVLPMLGDIAKLSPEDMKKAVQNLTTVMQMAAQQNLTPDQIAAILPQATGYGYTGLPGQTFTLNPGQTLSAIAAQSGIPVDQLLAATGAPGANMVMPGTYAMGGAVQQLPGFDPSLLLQGKQGDGLDTEETGRQWSVLQTTLEDMVPSGQELSDHFGTIKTNTNNISGTLNGVEETLGRLAKGSHKVDVELNITNLDFINSLIKGQSGGGGGSTTRAKTRDNGGATPGTDNRTAD